MAEDTWTPRDLPVLDYVVQRVDAGERRLTPAMITDALGMDKELVDHALDALYRSDESYIDGNRSGSVAGFIFVTKISSAARRATGAWPTAEGLADRLIAGLDEAADREPDPERKRRLRETARYLGGAARDVVVDVTATFAARTAGM